jgi:predicted HTH transcriptional regulator
MDNPQDLPTVSSYTVSSYKDVEQLVDGGIPENLHLEYKSGRPTNKDRYKDDIANDISAFANSDGGTLILGVSEKDNKPAEIDGVDERAFSRESLGQVISYKVEPPIPGLRIASFQGPKLAIFVVSVPRSNDAPHQGPNYGNDILDTCSIVAPSGPTM